MLRPTDLAIFEFRQYTLHPGRRDELIELFDREFVETQEAEGMAVLGQFRDLDDPDRFVWVRGFPDMTARHRSLVAFYGGPVWAAHRNQAVATMIDSDDVLLLRPVDIDLSACGERPPVGAPAPDRLVVAMLWFFPPGRSEGVEVVTNELAPALAKSGPQPLAVLVTEPSENTFPLQPVRTGENAVVVLLSYADEAAYLRHRAEVSAHPEVNDRIIPEIALVQSAAPQILRLSPTGRSLIR